MRRAFLKGIGLEHGCEAPAAPLKSAPPDVTKKEGLNPAPATAQTPDVATPPTTH